jgi:hypothetical protein
VSFQLKWFKRIGPTGYEIQRVGIFRADGTVLIMARVSCSGIQNLMESFFEIEKILAATSIL